MGDCRSIGLQYEGLEQGGRGKGRCQSGEGRVLQGERGGPSGDLSPQPQVERGLAFHSKGIVQANIDWSSSHIEVFFETLIYSRGCCISQVMRKHVYLLLLYMP